MNKPNYKVLFSLPVIVAALGYFVDIYDLILFGIVRVPSLQSLGVTDKEEITRVGLQLLSIQMYGMLLGGLIWGIIGDKKGRLSVLFGTILLYSIANILNGMVTSVFQYGVLRFIAGVGLAGELGIGITLVSEVLPKEIRGYGNTIVASIGMFGAVAAFLVNDGASWRVSYYVGGGLGLLLLIGRFSVVESGVYIKVKAQAMISRGNFFQLFTKGERLKRYLGCVFLGMPTWFVIGILVFQTPEFGTAFGFEEALVAGKAIMFTYIGIALGDIISGLMSQWLQSRKKVAYLFLILTGIMILLFVAAPIKTASYYYFTCVLLGISVGYWVLFVTIAAEQFGTNLRATVTTTVPNFIRGTVPLLTFFFTESKMHWGMANAVMIVGLATVAIAVIALSILSETFSNDLNFEETD